MVATGVVDAFKESRASVSFEREVTEAYLHDGRVGNLNRPTRNGVGETVNRGLDRNADVNNVGGPIDAVDQIVFRVDVKDVARKYVSR